MQTVERVVIEWVEGPAPAIQAPPILGAGAVASFTGIVRPTEDHRPLLALHYSRYDPMAQRELHRIAEYALARHRLLFVQFIHSIGRVDAGEASLQLLVAAAHRKPAIAAIDEIIDAMKRDVPIWKMPVYAEDRGQGT